MINYLNAFRSESCEYKIYSKKNLISKSEAVLKLAKVTENQCYSRSLDDKNFNLKVDFIEYKLIEKRGNNN